MSLLPNPSARRFALVTYLSLLGKVAAFAVFLVLAMRLSGGLGP